MDGCYSVFPSLCWLVTRPVQYIFCLFSIEEFRTILNFRNYGVALKAASAGDARSRIQHRKLERHNQVESDEERWERLGMLNDGII